MSNPFSGSVFTAIAIAAALGTSACVLEASGPEQSNDNGTGTLESWNSSTRHGFDVWFNNTYGGEKFFAFLAQNPDESHRIQIGFDAVVNTPRNVRFDTWGVVNDPGCYANPDGGPDICSDPESSGIIGIRKKVQADGTVLYGVACAACHAGFSPTLPPRDPNDPKWWNIHPTIGNQYLDLGAIFAAHLAPTDPRALMFAAWPKGTVDTTLLFSDNIMNPGVITAFWDHADRPTFDVGTGTPQLRNGQGGEDDVGGPLAATRVYTNIGVCFAECTAPAVATGQPIDVDACRQNCPDFPPQRDLDDLAEFLDSVRAPRYPGWREKDSEEYDRGAQVFHDNCASCHDDSNRALTNDQVISLAADPDQNTNICRSLTSNWERGKLWADFSSEVYKLRVETGARGYRVMPLTGIWATAPFMHNQSIGSWAPADASYKERGEVYEESMRELLSADRVPKMNVLPFALGPFPAGTPLTYVFSRDADGNLLCADAVENHGHYYGSNLSNDDKEALIHWLKFQ